MIEDLSITFDDAKKVFGVCMGIGTFMAAGVVWAAKFDAHRVSHEPMMKNVIKVTVNHEREIAVLKSEIINLKSNKPTQLANNRFEW